MCNELNCKLDNYKEQDKCILHCSKNSYSEDFNSGLLNDFYQEFKNYIILESFSKEDLSTRNDLINYLNLGTFDNNIYNKKFKETLFIPNKIVFPYSKQRDWFNYTNILNLFGKIHFNDCEFNDTDLELKDIKVFFQDCIFHNEWTLYNYDLLKNTDNIIYQQCIFHKNVSSVIPDDKESLSIYNNSQFDYYSTFKKSLNLNKCLFKEKIFNTNQNNYPKRTTTINSFNLTNSTIKKEFIIDDFEIQNLNIEESIFESKVKIQNSILVESKFYNTKFNDLADFYRTEFYKVDFERADFNKITVFAEATFYNDISFRYVKFLNKSIFRDTVIKGKLDLRDTIFNDEANFLDIRFNKKSKAKNIPIKVKNRETARIIKNFYDNSNNIIEANKFYALEMKKRDEELSVNVKNNIFEWIVFKLHSISSSHSQDWLLPLLWIINLTFIFSVLGLFEPTSKDIKYLTDFKIFIGCFSFIYFFICHYKISIFIYIIISGSCYYFSGYDLDFFATNLNPFSLMKEGDKLTMSIFIYKILMSYLAYQFIISIRQNTRRK